MQCLYDQGAFIASETLSLSLTTTFLEQPEAQHSSDSDDESLESVRRFQDFTRALSSVEEFCLEEATATNMKAFSNPQGASTVHCSVAAFLQKDAVGSCKPLQRLTLSTWRNYKSQGLHLLKWGYKTKKITVNLLARQNVMTALDQFSCKFVEEFISSTSKCAAAHHVANLAIEGKRLTGSSLNNVVGFAKYFRAYMLAEAARLQAQRSNRSVNIEHIKRVFQGDKDYLDLCLLGSDVAKKKNLYATSSTPQWDVHKKEVQRYK